jgi:hypothetical protein
MRDPVRTLSAAPDEFNAKPKPELLRARKFRIVRWHRCDSNHRTYNRFASCVWRKAVWVTGEGPFATVSYCVQWRPGYADSMTVMLHKTETAARHTLDFIDRTACGGGCSRAHELVRLIP